MAKQLKPIVTTPKEVYFSQQMSNVKPVTVTSHPAPPGQLSQEQQQPVQDAAGN